MRPALLRLFIWGGTLALVPGTLWARTEPSVKVTPARVPDSGLQARTARSADGAVHLAYFKGDLASGDVMYARLSPDAAEFGPSIRVNSQPGSASAGGTIRGPAIAVEPDGRAHVVWCGSAEATPRAPLNPGQSKDDKHNGTPLLYSRSDQSGSTFEPQRNLMTASWALDGGPAVAADQRGHVWVAWHAGHAKGAPDESGRGVFAAISTDHGTYFAPERRIEEANDGACACCGLAAGVDTKGVLAILYRRAKQSAQRDMTLLLSGEAGSPYTAIGLDPWPIRACPMTTACVVADGERMLVAWETKGQVSLARIEPATGKVLARVSPAGTAAGRKYPSVAVDRAGHVILTWADGAGWGSGGSVAWQVFDADLRAIGDAGNLPAALPAWTFPAPYASGDGFVVLY